mmetsp:Transcript_39225/g.58963  ORF Transcript_39225/g.58963 Transcript_39225/m.58963 type:complete len:113 (-) Transcript_39225:4-342(-)|eukprot:8827821-Ditylum_brightwellii.AAC.1
MDGIDVADGGRGGTASVVLDNSDVVEREISSASSRVRDLVGSNGSMPPVSVSLLRRREREQMRPEGVTTGSVGVRPEIEHTRGMTPGVVDEGGSGGAMVVLMKKEWCGCIGW